MSLAASRGGAGAPLMVLLHGLGATRQVWTPFLARAADHWPGRWLALDLPGHGESAPANDYAPRAQAALVAAAIRDAQPEGPLVVLGHSLGGVLAMILADGRQDVQPQLAAGLGVKVTWSPEEVAALGVRASAPSRLYERGDEAIDRFLKASGLAGLVPPASPIARSGVVAERSGGWRLAMDPRAYGVGEPPVAAALAAARCPVRLAAGANDPMSRRRDLLRFDGGAEALPGLGHNAMIENPDAVWDWFNRLSGSKRLAGTR